MKTTAIGPCWVCRSLFVFDPETVSSVLVDPVTDQPPDLGGDPDRAVARPLCPPCVTEANLERAKAGRRLIPVVAS